MNKELKFKNRFYAILSLIFKPKKFNKRFDLFVNGKVNEAVSNTEYKLTKDFEEKLFFLSRENNHKQLCHELPEHHRVVLLQAITPSITQSDNYINMYNEANYENHEVETLRLGIADYQQPFDYILKRASQNLADMLVDKGFIQTRSRGHVIEFYIQVLNP